jgi:hypothetical protein
MQAALEELGMDARNVHAYLAKDPDGSADVDVIADSTELTEARVASALRELSIGGRADESFAGWSVVF